METRIYEVKSRTANKVQMVEAANRAHALRRCAEEEFEVSVPNTKRVAELYAAGVRVLMVDEYPKGKE